VATAGRIALANTSQSVRSRRSVLVACSGWWKLGPARLG